VSVPRKCGYLAAVYTFFALNAFAQEASDSSSYGLTSDILYGVVDGQELKLDLYMPAGEIRPPLLVWVHGGAWERRSKETILTTEFVDSGYAMASIDFRLSGDAIFPAQVHDIKAAIRFLRRVAPVHGYDATRVGIFGSSSGGHLAALVGVTNGHEELEGNVGDDLDQSSDIQAIVSYYGAANLTTILKQSTAVGLAERAPALDLLLGGSPEARLRLATLASPVFHVDTNDPPLLMLHGDQDPQMPINQSHELHNAYEQHDLDVEFLVIHGGDHGGAPFLDSRRMALVKSFWDSQLR